MSTTTEVAAAPAVDELTHAAALTEADVDALETFLKERCGAMWRAHPDRVNSDAFRGAHALGGVLRDLVKPVRDSFRYDDGSREILRARMRHWNRLYRLAEPWEEVDGYDRTRWVYLFHLDAVDVADSAAYALQREQEQAGRERARLLGSL